MTMVDCNHVCTKSQCAYVLRNRVQVLSQGDGFARQCISPHHPDLFRKAVQAMGYPSHTDAGWTAAQCFAHAGAPKRKP